MTSARRPGGPRGRSGNFQVDRRRSRRRTPMHPLMEAYYEDLLRQGRKHSAEKVPSRLRPLEQWSELAGMDPAHAMAEQLAEYRAWVLESYRLDDGSEPGHHTRRHAILTAKSWYRWLALNGHREDDSSEALFWQEHQPRGRNTGWFGDHELLPTMQAYVEHTRLRGRAETARNLAMTFQQFLGWASEQGVDPMRLTRDQADAYLAWLTGAYRTPDGKALARKTAATRVAYLKAWYDWMETRGDIVANPMAKARIRVAQSRVVVREHLNLQEATALVQTAAARVVNAEPHSHTWARHMRSLAAISIGLATGRRISGIASLRVDKIDVERNELRVEREKGRTGRVLPVADWAMEVMRTYIEHARPMLVASPGVPWLFVDRCGTEAMSISALKHVLDQLITETIQQNPGTRCG